MKTCLRCEKEKDENQFGKDSRKPDGKRPYCKLCAKELTAAYRKSEDYCERERKLSRDYAREFKEDRREYRLEYESRPETRGKIRQASRLWRKRTPEKQIYYNAKFRSKHEGLAFNITPSDISIPEKCPALGIPLIAGAGVVTNNSPSIDQIEPGKGYIKGNVQIISHKANTMKSNATLAELRMLVSFMEKVEQERVLPSLAATV